MMFTSKIQPGTSEVAQQARVFIARSADLNLISETHRVEKTELTLASFFLKSTHMLCGTH